MRIFIGLLITAGGALMSIYNRKMVSVIGSVPWAEEHLGAGGSYSFYVILGVIIAFVGMTVVFDFYGGIITGILGPLFGR